MATPSKQTKLTFEILNDLTKEETLLGHLPDEIQLKIFKFLGIEDIICCAQVSQRTRRICNDESIWEKINLYSKVVPSKFIDQILQKGCKYINLRNAKIVGALKLSRKDYNVKYLNLTNCTADQGVLEKFISSCQCLQKLSLCNLELNSNAMKSLSHHGLQTLELSACRALNLELITKILSCKTLTEVSFRYNYLPIDESNNFFQYIVENLSSSIEKVSLGGTSCLTDKHIKILVQRCKKIKELEICGCRNITEDSLTSIAEHCDQMVKLDVSITNIGFLLDWTGCPNIPLMVPVQGRSPFLKVKSMPKLKVLNCQHHKRPSQETENLRNLMPHLEINCQVFGGDLHIAEPNESIEPEDGLWHIFVKSTELFPEKIFLL